MAADPPVNRDGSCALPGCEEQLPPAALRHGDPFHSVRCARRFFGVVFVTDAEQPGGKSGEKNGAAKLTEAQVVEIRRQRASGKKLREVAEAFGIDEGHVWMVATGRLWKHVPMAAVAA